MTELILILISAAFVNNVVLSQFLGLCPFLGVSKKTGMAAGMGTAIIFVITLSSALCSLVYHYILIPLDLEYLKTIVFILLIACLVQFVELVLKKYSPSLYNSLGVYLPLITTNCAVLGSMLINVQEEFGLLASVINGFGTSFGFAVVIIMLAGVRERIQYNEVPKAFQGYPIVLIVACLMAIAFYGFAGMI